MKKKSPWDQRDDRKKQMMMMMIMKKKKNKKKRKKNHTLGFCFPYSFNLKELSLSTNEQNYSLIDIYLFNRKLPSKKETKQKKTKGGWQWIRFVFQERRKK